MGATAADCSAMRSKINRIESEINELQRELRMMLNSLDNARSCVSSTGARLSGSAESGVGSLDSSGRTLDNAAEMESTIEVLNKKYKTIELSYKAIRALNNQLKYDEGNNRKVVKVTQAIIDNLVAGFVSDKGMEEVAEKLHLQTQQFYLSFIMMSIVLWRRGERSAAERAVEKAMELNAKSTAAFYVLFNYKFGLYETAERWLQVLMSEDITGEDSDMLIFMLLVALNPEIRAKNDMLYNGVLEYIRLACGETKRSSDKKLIDTLYNKMLRLCAENDISYNYLEKYCDGNDYLSLLEALRYAISNADILNYLQNLQKTNEGRNPKQFVDLFLDNEISNCKTESMQKIADEIRYHEAVIEARGDVEEAIVLKAEDDMHAEAHIVVNEVLYDIVYDTPEKFAGKENLNLFAYYNLNYLHEAAYDLYCRNYRELNKTPVGISIDSFKTATDFKAPESDKGKIDAHYAALRDEAIKSKKKRRGIIVGSVVAAVMLVLMILNVAGVIFEGSYALAIVGAVGVVIGAATIVATVLYNRFMAAKLTKEFAEKACRTKDEYAKLLSDYNAFQDNFREQDAQSVPVKEFFAENEHKK